MKRREVTKNERKGFDFNEKREKMAGFLKDRLTPLLFLRFGFALCLLVLTYAMLSLLCLEEFGGLAPLKERIVALVEHGLALLLLGIGGGLLFDLLDRWEKRSAD
ncbi:MAG: hypothetical protein J6M12_08870 [Clostridia bacterium]|nr:hypothetical protein [Clostridia bacterium]